MRTAGNIGPFWWAGVLFLFFGPGLAHEHTRKAFQQAREAAQTEAAAFSEPALGPQAPSCRLRLELLEDQSRRPLPGLIRIWRMESGKQLRPAGLLEREKGWFVLPPGPVVELPRTRVRIEALHGLDTERTEVELDLSGRARFEQTLLLRRFYDAAGRNRYAGNTHLHLRGMRRGEAERYLREVSEADGLDLVFVSYLRRIPDEREYISNDFTRSHLQALSTGSVRFANGQEHRHNFDPYGEGYGHVLFLDLLRLVEPVTIGPGIMQEGTDGIPLQKGIREARRQGASVVWCHNRFGLEDIPNWVAGLLHAQNIFDGGSHGSYEETFYRYLNIGLKVPFSTGTDWFIYDFSRVYVPVPEGLSSRGWLSALAQGRSFITNGPFLELQVEGRLPGETLALKGPRSLKVSARGVGRRDFRGLELLYNGEVVESTGNQSAGGHFEARIRRRLSISGPGWIALRIPLEAGENEFGKPLYAHTSPVYLEFRGRRIFRRAIAEELVEEMRQSMEKIASRGRFDEESERREVLQVYEEGIRLLKQRLRPPDPSLP